MSRTRVTVLQVSAGYCTNTPARLILSTTSVTTDTVTVGVGCRVSAEGKTVTED